MRRFAYNARARSGFTLIELMVVLVVIGILALAILPEMHGVYENALLRSATRQWTDVIGLTYSRAVSGNQAHRIRWDGRMGEYFIERHSNAPGNREGFVPVEDDTGRGKIDPRISVRFQMPAREPANADSASATPLPEEPPPGDIETIGFYPDGTADSREIVLRDRDGFRMVLRINPTTARVRILDPGHR